jgi:NADPH:quinone reductase-like Zn-dependent oxidoreductase
MGIVEGQKRDSSGLGCECAGVVHAVGSEVEDLKVGDRVIVFTAATLSTKLATKAKLCVKIPDQLSFEDAATMPCVYVTVIHSLLDLGRLEKDQVLPNSSRL